MPIGTKIPKLEKAALNLNKLFPQHFYKQKVFKKKKSIMLYYTFGKVRKSLEFEVFA